MTAISSLIARSSLGVQPRLVKLCIAGSRGLVVSHNEIHDAVDRLIDYGCGHGSMIPCEVVSGNARGVDRAGEAWAEACGLPVTRYPITPDEWRRLGRKAGPLRNEQMAVYAEALIAFWDGASRGTADMIDRMRARRKPVLVVEVKR